jgi:hypothetical protein
MIPLRHRDKGIMAAVGRRAAIAPFRDGLVLRGALGWAAWCGLHLFLSSWIQKQVDRIDQLDLALPQLDIWSPHHRGGSAGQRPFGTRHDRTNSRAYCAPGNSHRISALK